MFVSNKSLYFVQQSHDIKRYYLIWIFTIIDLALLNILLNNLCLVHTLNRFKCLFIIHKLNIYHLQPEICKLHTKTIIF